MNEKIEKKLLNLNFKKNAYGGFEKIIGYYHFTITEHPFNKIIIFNKYNEERSIGMPSELTLPKKADAEMIITAISKIKAGKDSIEIYYELGLFND